MKERIKKKLIGLWVGIYNQATYHLAFPSHSTLQWFMLLMLLIRNTRALIWVMTSWGEQWERRKSLLDWRTLKNHGKPLRCTIMAYSCKNRRWKTFQLSWFIVPRRHILLNTVMHFHILNMWHWYVNFWINSSKR